MNKNFKKIFSLILALVMIFTLCSCGKDKNSEEKEEITTEPVSNLNLEIGCGKTFAANGHHTVALLANGKVLATGENEYGQCNVSSWEDIVAIDNSYGITVGLKSDGTVVAVGDNEYGKCNVSKWTNIVAICSSPTVTYGVKSDGTVVTTGYNDDGQSDVKEWTNIVAVFANDEGETAFGLKSDGTVVATGDNTYGQCNVAHWTDIVKIVCNYGTVVGLKEDGTIVCEGDTEFFNNDCYSPTEWTDIVDIEVYDGELFFGLKADGTILYNGANFDEYAYLFEPMNGAIALSGNYDGLVGLMPNGTLVTYIDAYNGDGQLNFSGWTNIQIPKGYNR